MTPSIVTRRELLAAGAALAVALTGSNALAGADPVATLQSFYAVLLAAMRDRPRLAFIGRRQRLAPAVAQAYDLPLMTRLVVGLQWPRLSPDAQTQIVAAFTAFTVATYANQFDDYSGQRFAVDPAPTAAPDGDVIVRTKIIRSTGDPVQLDYLLRQARGDWRIIDVFLGGTISQLAARRSEFTAVLREKGAPGLLALLQEKTAALAAGSNA